MNWHCCTNKMKPRILLRAKDHNATDSHWNIIDFIFMSKITSALSNPRRTFISRQRTNLLFFALQIIASFVLPSTERDWRRRSLQYRNTPMAKLRDAFNILWLNPLKTIYAQNELKFVMPKKTSFIANIWPEVDCFSEKLQKVVPFFSLFGQRIQIICTMQKDESLFFWEL